jgi:hypothetical protein
VVTYPRALGPASESPPGRNPREPHGRLFLRFGHRAWSCAGSRAQPWPARFQCPAGLEVGGDPGSAEGVAADLCGLEKIEPIHVALYIEELQQGFSKPRDIAFRRCEPNFALIYIKRGVWAVAASFMAGLVQLVGCRLGRLPSIRPRFSRVPILEIREYRSASSSRSAFAYVCHREDSRCLLKGEPRTLRRAHAVSLAG